MNQEQIIELAKQAGFSSWALQTPKDIEAFAALVAAAEREACAKLCDVITEKNTWWDINEIEAAEECAAAIRAIGKTK
jgi:sugar phosphate isomerase/epimerase